ncbi:molybdopterin-dependent oxidoreductase [Dyella psychrodurans]|uniref:Sulfide dehydrogenase n=1 Tax=Dyella psychrodurans TaxID=1927960 RepID=A0A370XCE5_9GAMM|nr:molybdopterin-dependent oxidoreductase [Dyella psychrodurans]RDS86104.1 sulfide dehydrogenase [Dyella psychrodurans]
MSKELRCDTPSRRRFLQAAGLFGSIRLLGGSTALGATANSVRLPFVNGERELTRAFPQKGEMILLRTRPPLLETPFDVFDHGVFTPNDRFFVRWHLPYIPTQIDAEAFRLTVHGHLSKPLSLSLHQLMTEFESVEIAAINQCSGNSRGFFNPRVPGGQWANGAMGCARWTGVRLKDVLDRAGVSRGAVQVRFNGLDSGILAATPDFLKSLDIDHARDGEVMIAYGMNGEQLPVLNGFPLRLIVPGWYSTYWVKMLNDIEVLNKADDNYWMAKAYLIPDTPHASITPGQTGFKSVPINRMVPRSFITNLRDGDRVLVGHTVEIRGIAFGGDTGLSKVVWSRDGGAHWTDATLEEDHGKYCFRRWNAHFTPTARGESVLMVKAINTRGVEQPATANWNPGGFMRNVAESTKITIA